MGSVSRTASLESGWLVLEAVACGDETGKEDKGVHDLFWHP